MNDSSRGFGVHRRPVTRVGLKVLYLGSRVVPGSCWTRQDDPFVLIPKKEVLMTSSIFFLESSEVLFTLSFNVRVLS